MTEIRPLVWLLLGERLGDNAQIRTLGSMLGLASETKYLRYNGLYQVPNTLKGASLVSVQRETRHDLTPPWPDLVILCGRKSVATARWIKKQSKGRTKLIAIGRPRVGLDIFDLVVTTPQYRVPNEPNVVELLIPLSGVSEEDLRDARRLWKSSVADLPEPRIALLVGGDTTTGCLDEVAADRLGRLASRYAKSRGGSLMITTSPRTKFKAAEALINAITVPSKIHRWAPGLSTPNPYLGFIGMADEVIVTCDSASMIADAAVAKKPILLFDVPMQPRNLAIRIQHSLYLYVEDMLGCGAPLTLCARLLRYLAYTGYLTPPRNMARLYRNVVAAGHASWLVDACVDGNFVRPFRFEGMTRGVDEAVARIRDLVLPGGDAADAEDRLADRDHARGSGVA